MKLKLILCSGFKAFKIIDDSIKKIKLEQVIKLFLRQLSLHNFLVDSFQRLSKLIWKALAQQKFEAFSGFL